MGNDTNDLSIKLLEQRVSSIEANMPTKSDISVLAMKIDQQAKGFEAVEHLAEKIDRLVTQNAKREESDKHLEKAIESLNVRVSKLEDSDRLTQSYIAADKPFKEFRGVAIKSIVGLIVAGVFAAAFVSAK